MKISVFPQLVLEPLQMEQQKYQMQLVLLVEPGIIIQYEQNVVIPVEQGIIPIIIELHVF